MDVLPYDVESLAKHFHKWCMRKPVPGSFVSNDLFTLRAEEYAVSLDVKPAIGNIPHRIVSYEYASDKNPVGPELSLWFDDYTVKRVNAAVWTSILYRFCPDCHLRPAEEPCLWKEVVYLDGSVNDGEFGGTRQCIRMYLAQKQVRRVSPLTFADMEGVL